nr:cytoplasmic protein [Desulfobacterales bacterium]
MFKKELIFRNPLRIIGGESEDILPEGGFGAVVARAGVGKTPLLVQIALDSLLRTKNVLHISLDDPVKKICLWYDEVLRNIAHQYNVMQMDQLWEAILPHRFIMSFRVEAFSVPKLEERLTELTDQDIFLPQIIVIDGLPFDEAVKKPLSDLKVIAKDRSMRVWFTIRTHRHEKIGPHGMTGTLLHVADLFDVVIQLHPVKKDVHIKVLKGGLLASDQPPLVLDTSTMLIKDIVRL